MKLTRRRVILAKAEATYKAATTPDGTDALLVNMGSSMDVAGEEIKRTFLRDSMSPLGHVVASKVVNFKISTELRGGGKVTSDIMPPEFDTLLLACGMAETGSAALGWTYMPESDPDAHESCTIWWYEDGILHKAIGCRGTWSLNMTVNQIGSIEFNMTGIYVDPLDQALPTPTILDLVPPACAGIGLTVGSYTPVLSSLQLAMGNQVVHRKDLNADTGITGISIVDRQPAGSVDPEADKLSNFNPWSAWSSGTKASISATLGSTSGNKITITVPKAQYGGPKYGDRDGTLVYELPFTPTIDATGDDELKLEFL